MEESPLKMFVVHAQQGGLYLALVPACLTAAQIGSASPMNLGIDAGRVCEIGDWRTSQRAWRWRTCGFPA